jgi:hypothetical protein
VIFAIEDLRKLVVPAIIFACLAGAGAALVWGARSAHSAAQARLAGARSEHLRVQERFMRIADEEREARENVEVYRQLKASGILGEERRFEWVDAIARIQATRELIDVRYRVERRKLLYSAPDKPSPVHFYASTMKVELALLHEGDLLRFLSDLRDSGNAHPSVRRCRIDRVESLRRSAGGIAPRLRAECDIDLITIVDQAAKT